LISIYLDKLMLSKSIFGCWHQRSNISSPQI